MHDGLPCVFHDKHIAEAQHKMAKDNAEKDQGDACHPGIVSPSERRQVSLAKSGQILIKDLRIGPLHLKNRGIPIDDRLNAWNPKVRRIEPPLLRNSGLVIHDVLNDVSVNRHLCQIRKGQIQDCDGSNQSNGEQKQESIWANVWKEPSE